MANLLGSNPFVLDTAGGGVIVVHDIHAAHFEWSDYSNQNDRVEVQDRFGKIVWVATGKADLSLVESFTLEWLHGLNLTVLAAGSKLRLYYE